MTITKYCRVGEIVAYNYQAAFIFNKFKIDFCCNGDRTLLEATEQNNVAVDPLIIALQEVMKNEITNTDVDSVNWPLDLLVDYITKKHHRYVRLQMPIIQAHLDKVCDVHHEDHPELKEIRTLFDGCSRDLLKHMDKEESILFPYIQKLVDYQFSGKHTARPDFGSITNPINIIRHEHDVEGKRLQRINELTNNFTLPSDACSTYKVTYAMLEEFESDLHRHVHLENNILFKRLALLTHSI